MMHNVLLSPGCISLSGLEFINQLSVDDEESAATLVAVSSKYVYAPRFT